MRLKPAPQCAVATRDRILDAAVLRFSRHSYDETGLRDVAADVGIDASYVHRCFGSKESLFAEALAATIQPDRLFANSTSNLLDALAKQVFPRDGVRAPNEVGPLDIVVRSLSCPEATRVLREFILNDFIEPLARRLDQPPSARIALIAALLAGVGLLRNVLHIAPLLDTQGGELESLIANALKGMMDADLVTG